ncbi:hypothetical protein Bbelb_060980 [Branchiostoma belcheri]|nr:hypothetical protein Bbelb_060980 [Branchiostoma belcheri]
MVISTVGYCQGLLHLGVSAITCYLHACRHTNESKCRKYLAKVIWLLTYDDDKGTLAEAVDKYCIGVPHVQWLPWIPQLLTCLIRNEGKTILNLLSQVGRVYPQAVYFPIRTMYLTLKIEQRERYKSGEVGAGVPRTASPSVSGKASHHGPTASSSLPPTTQLGASLATSSQGDPADLTHDWEHHLQHPARYNVDPTVQAVRVVLSCWEPCSLTSNPRLQVSYVFKIPPLSSDLLLQDFFPSVALKERLKGGF